MENGVTLGLAPAEVSTYARPELVVPRSIPITKRDGIFAFPRNSTLAHRSHVSETVDQGQRTKSCGMNRTSRYTNSTGLAELDSQMMVQNIRWARTQKITT